MNWKPKKSGKYWKVYDSFVTDDYWSYKYPLEGQEEDYRNGNVFKTKKAAEKCLKKVMLIIKKTQKL